MKIFFHAVLVLPLALFAAACSDNDGDEAVKLESGTDTKQQVFADDTAPAPIRFTAAAAWTATVTDTTPVRTETGKTEWLELDRYSGDAGEVTLTMTLSPNYTGADRKAEIRIACGGTTIVITVEQKGTKADGTQPQDPENPDKPAPAEYALVERIDVDFDGWSELPDDARQNDLNLYPAPSDMYFAFRYDDRNRIVEYEKAVYCADEQKLRVRSVSKFDYSVEGEIRMTERRTYDENETRTFGGNEVNPVDGTEHIIRLDARNRAAAYISGDGMMQPHYFYSYDDDGRLSRIETVDDGYHEGDDANEWVELAYRNGVVSDSTHYHCSYGNYTATVPESTFNEHPNDRISIDPNHLYASYSDNVFDVAVQTENRCTLPLLRLTGKGSDRLMSVRKTGEWSGPRYSVELPYMKPDITIPGSCEDYERISPRELHYTFNDDGTIACIIEEETWIRVQYEYDVVVGSELLHPNYPEGGYDYTIKEKKKTESARGKDIYKYTFTYRK
ncbi:MAG: hypothetical protein NC250_03725 [Alistipes senegalensis]|nr:hypothetical protein [Bacteroides cellulosilyticus]MCM1351825.1 hypothetical protein [Alistipes senegalensis]